MLIKEPFKLSDQNEDVVSVILFLEKTKQRMEDCEASIVPGTFDSQMKTCTLFQGMPTYSKFFG